MLLNTGGVTQSFGSMHHWCVTKKAFLEQREKSEQKRCSLIMQKVAVVSTEPWARKFGLAQIMMMQELEKRAPDVMRKVCNTQMQKKKPCDTSIISKKKS